MHSWVWIKHQHDIKEMRKSNYKEKNYTYCLDSFWNDFFSAEKRNFKHFDSFTILKSRSWKKIFNNIQMYNNYILQLNPNIFFPVLHFEKSLHLKNIFYDRCTQEVKVWFLTSEPCMHEHPHILLMLKRWWEGEGGSEGRERKRNV